MVCIMVTALQINPLKTIPADSQQKTKVSLNLTWFLNVSTNQPESSAHFSGNLKWHNYIHQTKICTLHKIENKILQKHEVKLYQTMLRPVIGDMATTTSTTTSSSSSSLFKDGSAPSGLFIIR